MKKYLSIRVVEAESLEEAEEEVKKGNFLEDDPRCDLVIEDEQKEKEQIIQSMAYYFAHYHCGDGEGMDIALGDIADSIVALFPELKKLEEEEFCRCPHCHKMDWEEISYCGGKLEIWCEGCEKKWEVKLN